MGRAPTGTRPQRGCERRAPSWRRYLRFWGTDLQRDLDDELRFHLEARYEEYLAEGKDPGRARAEAEERFGDFRMVRDQCAAIDTQWQREQTMSDFIHVALSDLRYALRQLRRNASLSLAAVLCFALGIGANTSIFSVVDAVLFRPLPFPNDDRLVIVGEALPSIGSGNFGQISAPDYVDYRELDGRTFDRSAIVQNSSSVVSGAGETERISTARVSATLFEVLGVRAALGRAFIAGEDAVDAAPVVVLSDGLWRRKYNADASIVGRTITVGGAAAIVAGVMGPEFSFPIPGIGGPAEMFVPLQLTPGVMRMRGDNYNTYYIARLAKGVTVAQAGRAVNNVASTLPQRYPDVYRGAGGRRILADAFSLRERAVGSVRKSLLILLAAVGCVLLIACINVSSLLLARAAARQREFTVRRALGATRARLIQQFLAESIVLVVAGGALGLAFAHWGARLLATSAPQSLLQGYTIGVDGRVLAVTAAVTIATALVFSLIPALQQSDRSLATGLHEEARGASGGVSRQRGRRTLVVTEIALASILAAGAGLMIKSFAKVRGVDPGFNPQNLVSFRVGLPAYRYAEPFRVTQFEQRLIGDLARIPGVTAATAATTMPMSGGGWQIAFSVEENPLPKTPIGNNTIVMPGYFETMQIRLRDGRGFSERDVASAPSVAVINETLARTYFPKGNPVGRRIKWGSPTSPREWSTVIGVVPDVRQLGLEGEEMPAIYFPYLQADTMMVNMMLRGMTYIVRTSRDPETVMLAIRKTVHDADPELPIVALGDADQIVSTSVAARRFNTFLLGTFAALALVLAAVGIYGLMAFAVVQRTREIGIRLAIGADAGDVLRLVVGQGARLALMGVALGLVGAFFLTRVMRTLLYDVSPLDPMSFAAAALLLLGIAALASYLPARRASRIDPQLAIRSE